VAPADGAKENGATTLAPATAAPRAMKARREIA
jgi:hypothetical protein